MMDAARTLPHRKRLSDYTFCSPFIIFCFLCFFTPGYSQGGWEKDSLLYEENFESGSPDNWVSELVTPDLSTVEIRNGKLNIDVGAGATIWFKPKLAGNIFVQYDVTVIADGGDNDRVSDLNQFWMATDPADTNLFTRNGDFSQYDELRLYYVGMGGNNNSTTRFRRYPGNGERPIFGEYTDSSHLLKANTNYRIEIVCFQGLTQFIVNDQVFFELDDPEALTEGNFGIRTVRNHETVDNFKVYRLIDPNTKILPGPRNVVFDNEYMGGMQIFNLSGKLIKEIPPSFSWKEDIVKITGLSRGMYFLKPTSPKKLLTIRIFLVD